MPPPIVRLVIAGVLIVITQLLAWAGLNLSKSPLSNITIMQITMFISVLINFVAYLPAYYFQTEKYYDLTGSITYITCIIFSYLAAAFGSTDGKFTFDLLASVASGLTLIWAIRLGSFLFKRILQTTKDGRFDKIKPSASRFLLVWMIQALWCCLTALPVFYINSSIQHRASTPLSKFVTKPEFAAHVVGLAVWIFGFLVEVISDYQKTVWRHDPSNEGKFIQYGLWRYSRHPNYFGEITLWFGMFILCAPALVDTQWVCVISPIFVFVLIYFVSGVRLLEKRADEKWGGKPDYEAYKKSTSVLIPMCPSSQSRSASGEADVLSPSQPVSAPYAAMDNSSV